VDGILIVNKPQGMTSHDVVSFLRRKTGVRRIGHSGTLDPMATGVLPVFVDRATRVIEYAGKPNDPEAKKYRCTMRLGLSTDTHDIWGAERERAPGAQRIRPDQVTRTDIERVLKTFEGAGTQKPPMYSAVKVGGRKLYEYARAGKTVDEELLRIRDIYIKQISVIDFDAGAAEATFDIVCSKGVYVRTICDDAGRLLGCGAVMSGLVRLASDGFLIEDAVPISSLEDQTPEEIAARLLPLEDALRSLPRVDLDEENAAHFQNGRPAQTAEAPGHPRKLAPAQAGGGNPIRVYAAETLLGIGLHNGDIIKPHKVLKQVSAIETK
jgi:tRNA pseudouridine55 synthase